MGHSRLALALAACTLICGAQALLPEMPDAFAARPAAAGGSKAKPAGGVAPAPGGIWGSPDALATSARASDRYVGRLEKAPGYGTYLCYNKGMFDDVPADSSELRRVTLAAPEAVPAANASAPTVNEVIAWAADKFNVSTDELALEAKSDAVAANDWVDANGVRHVRLVQKSPRWDMTVDLGAVIVHLQDGNAIMVTGGVVPDLSAKTSKEVTTAAKFISPADASAAAIRAALSTVPDPPKGYAARLKAAAAAPTRGPGDGEKDAPGASVQPLERVVHCSGKDGTCRPTYKQVMFLPATATTGPKELHAYVSAVDGNVLYMTNRLRTAKPRKTSNDELLWLSLGRGNSLYAGQVPINTAASSNKKNGGPYQMNDLVNHAKTYDMLNHDDDYFAARPMDTLYRDKDNVWGDFSTKSRQSAAVDAHWGATTTLHYYKAVHGREGVDGKASPIQSRVHTSVGFDNAYWYNMKMTYGDGSRDPKLWNTSCDGFPPLTPLDIIAHEITHGITEYTAGLVYSQSMGGINEGMSDIMSQCVIDYAHDNEEYPRKADFKLGAQLYPTACAGKRGFLRSMIDPTSDNNYSSGCWHEKFDKTFNETHGDVDMWCYVDVHWSSGVANRAFYLMAEGLDKATCGKSAGPKAIGIKDACSVFYRTLSSYLSRVADYHELRMATAQAAADLFGAGSPQVSAVNEAWDVVGAPRAPYPAIEAPKCKALFAAAPLSCNATTGGESTPSTKG